VKKHTFSFCLITLFRATIQSDPEKLLEKLKDIFVLDAFLLPNYFTAWTCEFAPVINICAAPILLFQYFSVVVVVFVLLLDVCM